MSKTKMMRAFLAAVLDSDQDNQVSVLHTDRKERRV